MRSACELVLRPSVQFHLTRYILTMRYLHYILLSLYIFTTHAATYSEQPAAYAVSSAHPLATQAGLDILATGGNAFDAAIAVSAVLAVVEPYSSGIGGGGFWLLHDGHTHRNVFIDGREVAPASAKADMFLGPDGHAIAELSLNGGLAAAIPGEPAALVEIAKRYGRLPLSISLAPAIRLAEQGFPMNTEFYNMLQKEDRLQQIRRFPATAAIFLHKNQPYPLGKLIIQKDLAQTLRKIATFGHDGFYRGEVAKRLVESVNGNGGHWSLNDLANYKIKIRQPLEGNFHHIHIVTSPPPSAGGVFLLTSLNILSAYPLTTYSNIKLVHFITEAMRLSYWQRMQYLADPDFVTIPLAKLLSQKNAQELRRYIQSERATPSESLKTARAPHEGQNTTHFSILDQEGNRVAATLSINYIFGSSLIAQGTGVLLNDEMDDFAAEPTGFNVFSLIGGEVNRVAPGRRPLSSMAPTFLETPERVAILGTPGGSRIPTMILLATLAFYQDYGAISMVSTMRFHHQYSPDILQFEPDTFSPIFQKELQQIGYRLQSLPDYYGNMQAITWDRVRNFVTAAADPRGIGSGLVFKPNKKR